MRISSVVPQLRTTNLAASIAFYTEKLGFTLQFQHEDFYAGLLCGEHVVHVKLADAPDPSITWVAEEGHFHLYLETPDVTAVANELKRRGVRLVADVHDTAWGTRECVITDNEGHTLYFGERR